MQQLLLCIYNLESIKEKIQSEMNFIMHISCIKNSRGLKQSCKKVIYSMEGMFYLLKHQDMEIDIKIKN